jgi:hypothetical protein
MAVMKLLHVTTYYYIAITTTTKHYLTVILYGVKTLVNVTKFYHQNLKKNYFFDTLQIIKNI